MRLSSIKKITAGQEGVTLFLSILVLAAILAISFSLATVLFVEIRTSGDLTRTEGSLYASSGVGEQAFYNLTRQVCPPSTPTCFSSTYIAQFPNQVSLPTAPVVSPTSTPVFQDKVAPGSTFGNTSNVYYFCSGAASTSGCGYGKVTVTYLPASSGQNLKVFLCQFNPTEQVVSGGGGPGTYSSQPCSDPTDTGTGGSDDYWLENGTNPLNSTTNSSQTWFLNSGMQQELILDNEAQTGYIYVSIATTDGSGNPLGLPLEGATSVDINSLNGQTSRKIQVIVPKSYLSSSATALYLIDNGGGSLVDSQGRTWTADSSCNYGGNSYTVLTTTSAISNAASADQPIYQTQCYNNGNMSYNFPSIADGNYSVKLKFSENWWGTGGHGGGIGSRQFNIIINGTTVAANFDIYAAAGGPLTAVDQTYTAVASGGSGIQIQLQQIVGENNPTIDGIEIDK